MTGPDDARSPGAVTVRDPAEAARRLDALIGAGDLHAAAEMVEALPPSLVVDVLERSGARDRAVVFRLLPKGTALVVFEALDPPLQSELIRELHADRVNQLFTDLDPDDRAGLVDELPAHVATRLLRELDHDEQALTAAVLDYPTGSVGRRMSPELSPPTPTSPPARPSSGSGDGSTRRRRSTRSPSPTTNGAWWGSWDCARSCVRSRARRCVNS